MGALEQAVCSASHTADRIIIDGDPLDDIEALMRRVCFVMKDGKVYKEQLDRSHQTAQGT